MHIIFAIEIKTPVKDSGFCGNFFFHIKVLIVYLPMQSGHL